jgi:hypothetical protein
MNCTDRNTALRACPPASRPKARRARGAALALSFLLFSPALDALIIYEIAKVECRISVLYKEPVPDDEDKAEILRVPYVAEGEVLKVLPDEKNLDPYRISGFKHIRINAITFADPESEGTVREGDVIVAYLHYSAVEYHHAGYKESISLHILEITGENGEGSLQGRTSAPFRELICQGTPVRTILGHSRPRDPGFRRRRSA